MRKSPKVILSTLRESNLSARNTAKILGIHRSTVYRWKKRASVNTWLPLHLLKRKSTRPHKLRGNFLSERDIKKALKLRTDTGWTAEKIVWELHLPVSSLTLHRKFKKLGVVREYGYHRRPLFQNTGHMNLKNTKSIGYLQFDAKYLTPELTGLPWTCFEYAVIDIFSRYKEAVIVNHLDQDASISALLTIIPRLPFKVSFLQTDNGLEFQNRFKRYVEAMGIKYHYIHKNTPNENAVIERAFRTDEEEFFLRLTKAPQNYDELRDWFGDWIYRYNNLRPHLGLNLKKPIEVIHEQLVANV